MNALNVKRSMSIYFGHENWNLALNMVSLILSNKA